MQQQLHELETQLKSEQGARKLAEAEFFALQGERAAAAASGTERVQQGSVRCSTARAGVSCGRVHGAFGSGKQRGGAAGSGGPLRGGG